MRIRLRALIVALAAGWGAPALGQIRAAPLPPDSLVVSTEWLANRLGAPGLVIIGVQRGNDTTRGFAVGHIPGAQGVDYAHITMQVSGISTELPPVDSLRSMFERRGVSDASRIVVYSDDPIQAARAFWTLEYLGLARVSIMSGGFSAWRDERRAVETGGAKEVARGSITATPRPEIVANADYLTSRTGKPGFVFVDTRTVEEFDGTGTRGNLPSKGHVEGARLVLWQDFLADSARRQFKPRAELAKIFADAGYARGDSVVTYCYVGYRASISYFVARYVGAPVKIYDGSYQDWAAKGLPTIAGSGRK